MLRIGSFGITSDDPPCRRDLAELLAINSEYYTTREVQDQVLHTGEQIASSDRSDMLGNVCLAIHPIILANQCLCG